MTMQPRKVIILKWVDDPNQPYEASKLVTDCQGIFLAFGIDTEKHGGYDGDLATVSTAIVELSDGTVRNVPLSLIKFIWPTTITT